MPATAKRKKNNITPMKTIRLQPTFYNVDDVMKLMGVSRRTAQETIRKLRSELDGKGYYLPARGRISKKYFHEKYGD